MTFTQLSGHNIFNPLLQLGPGSTKAAVQSHVLLLPLKGPVEQDLVTVGLLAQALVTGDPGGDELKPVGLTPNRQHEIVNKYQEFARCFYLGESD